MFVLPAKNVISGVSVWNVMALWQLVCPVLLMLVFFVVFVLSMSSQVTLNLTEHISNVGVSNTLCANDQVPHFSYKSLI